MNIGDVLTQAWKTIWKHKVLWIFGILAGCGSASYSSSNGTVTYQVDAPVRLQNFVDSLDPALLALYVGLIILAALVVLVLVVFFSTIGRIGLIRGTYQSSAGAERLSFGSIFSGSTPYFWRVFGLNLLVGVLSFIAIFGVIIIGVIGTIFTLGLGALCLVPLLCLLVPAVWLLGIFVEQSIIAIVLEDKGVMDGLRRGWQVFKEHLGDMLILGLLFLVINIVVSLVLIVPLLGVTIPLITGLFTGTAEAVRNGLAVAVIVFICYTPLLLLLNGLLRSYFEAAWTLNFIRYKPSQPEVTPEIEQPLPSPI